MYLKTMGTLWLAVSLSRCGSDSTSTSTPASPASPAPTPAPTPAAESSVPKLVTENVSVARSDIRIWNVEPTGPLHEGTTTSNESGTVNVAWSDGTTTSHDANYKVTSATLYQDGKVCHNFGPKCYCATTTFRLESGQTMWHFGTPSGNTPVACPTGIQPTGDAEIRKAMTTQDINAVKARARREHGHSR